MLRKFQSTHPGWGATLQRFAAHKWENNFNPRTPGGVRLSIIDGVAAAIDISIHAPRVGCDMLPSSTMPLTKRISIHAPRVGCDPCAHLIYTCPFYFNPRTPGGVRHPPQLTMSNLSQISIHAPRVGCDFPTHSLSIWTYPDFNPRTPGGVRHELPEGVKVGDRFQSTHPGWGATTRG